MKLKYASALLAGALLLLHMYQAWDSSWDVRPVIRAAYCLAYIPLVLIMGNKVIPWAFAVFALVIETTASFENYTPFFMILLAGLLIPRHRDKLYGLYGTACIAHLTWSGASVPHVVIHLLNCIALWYAVKMLFSSRIRETPLELTESERRILDDLLEGKQQKELTYYSQNTITKKIRQARDRNHIRTTAELLMRYAAEKSI